jgi:transcriptional regulator with XRE-family HTH domain
MPFGQIIADARKKLNISQKDLAERIKKEDGEAISAQYLNDIERDRRNPPSEYLIEQFAKELKLSKNYLLAAAGSLPADLKQLINDSDPHTVEQAFQAFRRRIK